MSGTHTDAQGNGQGEVERRDRRHATEMPLTFGCVAGAKLTYYAPINQTFSRRELLLRVAVVCVVIWPTQVGGSSRPPFS